MKKKKYQIAVIIVNFNTSNFTADCVKSIIEKTSQDISFQIVVIDNSSNSSEFPKLIKARNQIFAEWHTKNNTLTSDAFIVFKSKFNIGFSAGNTLGVQMADADYYYFLNNDTILRNDCLKILHSFMQNSPNTAICSGQMYNIDDQKQLNFGYLPSLRLKFLGTGILRMFSKNGYQKKHTNYTKPIKVDTLNGSSMFTRASIFEKIGGFDTNYFLYCEEEDLGIRLKKLHYDLHLVPDAEYKHFVSQSSKTESKINLTFLKEFYISYFYYFKKHKGFFKTEVMRLYMFFRYFFKFFYNLEYVQLAFFILMHPHLSDSMRFKHKKTQENIDENANENIDKTAEKL